MKRSLFIALLLLCGCHRGDPPAPTAEQSRQLNEAENMLNDMAGNGSDQPQASNAASETSPAMTKSGTANRSHAP
jgi:hypothetical protein